MHAVTGKGRHCNVPHPYLGQASSSDQCSVGPLDAPLLLSLSSEWVCTAFVEYRPSTDDMNILLFAGRWTDADGWTADEKEMPKTNSESEREGMQLCTKRNGPAESVSYCPFPPSFLPFLLRERKVNGVLMAVHRLQRRHRCKSRSQPARKCIHSPVTERGIVLHQCRQIGDFQFFLSQVVRFSVFLD